MFVEMPVTRTETKMQNATACHDEIDRCFRSRGFELESMVAVERAQELYGHWRPEKIRVALLAESAVYTAETELCRSVHLPAGLFAGGMPDGFVRLVLPRLRRR